MSKKPCSVNMGSASMGLLQTKNGEGSGAERSRAPLRRGEAATLLRNFYAIGTVISVLDALSAFLSGEHRIAILGLTAALLFAVLMVLAQTHRVRIAGILGTGLLLSLLLIAVVSGHGIRDLAFPAFAFVILLANLVLDARSAQVATFMTWVVATGTALAEYLGLYQTDFSSHTKVHSVVVVGLLYLGIAWTARLLVRAYNEGLQRAQIQQQSYRHIFNATTEAIFLIDPESRKIVDANRSAVAMFGYGRKELLESSLEQLAGSHRELNDIERLIAQGQKGESNLFEWVATNKSGVQLPVEISLRPAHIGEEEVLLAVVRDATETRSLHDKLRESEKLQVVGQLAGGIAHDFNNQLTGILANATLLHDKLTDERLKKSAEVIVRCSRRSSDLTSQLLAFARRGKHQNVLVDLHELILEVVALLEHTIDKRILIETRLATIPLLVQGDPTLLQNALLNLGLNARDAMPEGGTLTFETARQLIEVTRTGISVALSHGDYARVIVSDTGEGMSEQTEKRIFEPFFTTKERGNGMGLAAVYGAIESHRGDISVRSKLGEGTTFTLLLPIKESDQESVSFRAIPMTQNFDGIRILVAEDEPDVALSTVALLEEMGCLVTLRKDGAEALQAFQENHEAFDLVLVDHMMPKLTGLEALKQMRTLKPSLKAIITSGFSNDAVIDKDDETLFFLPKPFNLLQLSTALGQAIAKGAETKAEVAQVKKA